MKLKEVSKDVMNVFSRNLKRLMYDNKISGIKLAKMCDVNKSAVSRWLNAVSLPNDIRLQQIADYFHVSVDDLLGKKEQKETMENVNEKVSYSIPENINTFEEARDFLKSLNLYAYGGIDLNQKSENDIITLARTILSTLQIQGKL